MQSLIDHARTFPHRIAEDRRADFAQLAHGQRPQALFITCSDSRVIPALFTGAQPGEIFESRNAGNIVPRYDPHATCGVGGTLEFALTVLDIPDIVICGHSHCGAVNALESGQNVNATPLLGNWLSQADHHPAAPAPGPGPQDGPAQRHLLRQLAHLRTYPLVQHRLAARRLRLHGWYYTVETGEVLVHRASGGGGAGVGVAEQGEFLPL